MDDIIQSRSKAMVRQGWMFGDKTFRLGNPFEWIDGDRQSYIYSIRDIGAVMQALSMYYEEYPTPKEVITKDYEEILSHSEQTLDKTLRYFAPFLADDSQWKMHVKCTALVRTQDYCCIKTFCKNLPSNPNHVDIGPGLGSHAIYSLKGLNSCFYGVEANPHMYSIQRNFFRLLSSLHEGEYLDPIECENFAVPLEGISSELKKGYNIKHIPSWHFPLVKDSSADLVTATWVLNELNHAGVLYLLANSSRVLKEGGYVYIRDSSKLKPNRHTINYDQLLQSNGYERVGKLDVENRVTLFGIPRIYQKKTSTAFTFEQLADKYLGKFAVVSHGGEYNQNLS